mgnify:FL=1
MVQKNSFEKFVQRAIHKLTRSSSIIKYVPKSLHNGVVVGDCAVIRNKAHTFDIYSKQRQALRKDILNHKIAICMATLLNQYTQSHDQQLKELAQIDTQYAIAVAQYHKLKASVEQKPHLEDDLYDVQDEVLELSSKIDDYYTAMTL